MHVGLLKSAGSEFLFSLGERNVLDQKLEKLQLVALGCISTIHIF